MRGRWFLYTVFASFILLSVNTVMVVKETFTLYNGWIIDTTTIDQALSSTLLSHVFFQTPVPGGMFFMSHATTFFFAILPFYSFLPNFIGTYIIEYALLYSPSIPIYLLARKIFNDEKFAFLFSLSYLFYTSVLGNLPFAGEEIIMFMGPAIFSIYFLETRRKGPFFVSFILMLSTIEFAPILGVFFFFYVLIREDVFGKIRMLISRRVRGAEFLGTFSNFYLVSVLVLSISFYFFDSWMTLFFSKGTHPIIINLQGVNFFSISSLLKGVQSYTALKYSNLLYLEGPFLFLSFLDPIFLIQIPWLLATLFSTSTFYFLPGAYYDAFVAAFVPVGFLFGYRKIANRMDAPKVRNFHKRLVIIVLVLTLLIFASIGEVQYYETYSSERITPQDQGIVFLSQMLTQGEGVDVGVNELPVTGIFDWNDTYYNIHTDNVIFRNEPPFSLAGYGFYAADGSFMMYERNYTSQPVYNNFYYSNDQNLNQQTFYNFFSPPGNYSINLSLNHYHYSEPLTTGSSSGNNYFIPLGDAIAIPFELKRPAVLQAVSVETINEGSVWLYGEISSSDTSVPIQSPATANFNFQYFKFDNITISPDETYYFWLIPGSPGGFVNTQGIDVQESSSPGISYLGSVKNSVISGQSTLNFSVPITLYIKASTPSPLAATMSINGKETNITLSPDQPYFSKTNAASGLQMSFVLNTNFTNYASYYGSNITLSFYVHKNLPTNFWLDYPFILLLLAIAIGLPLIYALYRIDFGQRRHIINRTSATVSLLTFVAFWLFYAIGYEGIVPFVYNILIFKAIGFVLAVSFLLTIITYDWK